MLQVSLARHRNHQTACYVLSETCNLVGIAGYILLTDVGQKHIDQVVARLRRLTFCRASDTASKERLIEMNHLDQLVLDV